MTTPSTSSSRPPPQQPVPMDVIAEGLTQNSTAKVQQGLDLFANGRRGLNSFALDRALSLAVKRAKPDIVRYLLDTTDVNVENLPSMRINSAMDMAGEEGVGRVIDVLEVLVENGWDVNGRGKDGSDSLPLVYHVYGSEELLRWCLGHGARVDCSGCDPSNVPSLLEYVGKGGTISTFELLMENGAKLGRRTLHRAVEGASSGEPERMEMVRFLVEEMGCDVNGMDMPVDKRYSAHYGTPLNYAAHNGKAVDVVKYLLKKGANPEIEDCWGFNAFNYARSGGESVLEVLTQWKKPREKIEA